VIIKIKVLDRLVGRRSQAEVDHVAAFT